MQMVVTAITDNVGKEVSSPLWVLVARPVETFKPFDFQNKSSRPIFMSKNHRQHCLFVFDVLG